MTHFRHLCALIPKLPTTRILDIGSGEGAFAIEAAIAGASVQAIEFYQGHIDISERRAKEAGVSIPFFQGAAESLPFPENSYSFINMSEVLEHVENPIKALQEAHRVLSENGSIYTSIPNRFGFRDPHYHLYFINWLPRNIADHIVELFHKNKRGEDLKKGRQRLSEMHYATYGSAAQMMRSTGFVVRDIREIRIRNQLSGILLPIALMLYRFMRMWYFDSFHFLLTKQGPKH